MKRSNLVCTFALITCLLTLFFAPVARAETKPTGKPTGKPSGKEVYEAAIFQDQLKLQELIKRGGDVNYRENGRPILGWAAQSGNVAIVDTLLKAGADPNAADDGLGHTPLMRAIDMQQVETVVLLLKNKANPNAINKEGKSCLDMAVQSHKPKIVQALVIMHADVKRIGKDGDSPALMAAQDGSSESLEIIKIIGKAGADLNASNIIYTPLVYAVEQGNKDLVKALLDAGASPNAQTQSGKIPLVAAFDNPEILQMLIAAKADLNANTGSNTTPLTEAVQNGNLEVVKTLLRAGADAKKLDASGRSALEIAEGNYQNEIAQLIREKVGSGDPKSETGKWALGSIPVEKGSSDCTVVDAAKKQMELHRELQAQVNAGKMSDQIFRTFNEDTKDYSRMLTQNPPEACALFARLRKKYGL